MRPVCVAVYRSECTDWTTVQVSYARPSSESIRDANVYVCGLPRSLTQHELEQIFSSCGNIISARIIYDNQTGITLAAAALLTMALVSYTVLLYYVLVYKT